MSLCSEADSTALTSEGSLKVMNIHVESQLGGLRENLLTDPTHRLAVLVNLEYFLRVGDH